VQSTTNIAKTDWELWSATLASSSADFQALVAPIYNYMNSGHGTPATTVEDFTDFHRRMLDWYGKYLKKDLKKVADAR